MLAWVSSTSGHCGSHRCCLLILCHICRAGPSHGCPLCDGRNRVKQAVLWSGDPTEPFFLLSAPCPAFSDRSLDLGFLLTLPHSHRRLLLLLSCLCHHSLGWGVVFPPVLSLDVTVAKLTVSWPYSSLVVPCAFSPISGFLSSIYWFSRNLESNSHPHQLLWSPLGGGCSLGTQGLV